MTGRRIAVYRAAGRVGGLGGDAGQFQRARVGPAHMAALAPQPDGMFRRDAVQVFAGREGASFPQRVVPAAPVQPLTGGRCCGASHHAGQGFLQRGHFGQVDFLQTKTVRHKVQVGIGKAGHDGTAMQVYRLSLGRQQCPYFGVAAHCQHLVAGYGYRLGAWRSGIHRVYVTVVKYQIGLHVFSLSLTLEVKRLPVQMARYPTL